ncbi:MAG: hypothetical protein ACK56W_05470 [Pirellula sp.]
MDPITRLVVFGAAIVLALGVWGFLYTRITGKPFIVVNKETKGMADNSAPPSALNRQMSPLSIAILAGIGGFALIYVQSSNLSRALFVAPLTFCVIYFVVWKGQKLEQQRKQKKSANN